MEALFKRYFWVVTLAALGVSAYMLATTINEYVAAKLLATPGTSLTVDADGVSAFGLMSRAPEADNLSDILKARRAFNSDPPPVERVADDAPGDEPVVEEEVEDDAVKECDQLGVTLVGTMMAVDPATSAATIESGGMSRIIWVGSTVADTAEVREISRRYIRLQQGDKECVIRLWADKQVASALPGSAPPPRPRFAAPPPTPKPAGLPNYKDSVKKLGDNEYEISRGMLDTELDDLGHVAQWARVVPNYRDGHYEGFKLVGVRPNGLYSAIGLRGGDSIKRINGKEITNPGRAIELLEEFKSASDVQLDVERLGKVETLSYTIK